MLQFSPLRGALLTASLALGLLALSGPSTSWLPEIGPGNLQLMAHEPPADRCPALPGGMTQIMAPVDGQILSTSPNLRGTDRALRPGDIVHRGQLLAVIWSLEVGERKSRLLAAASRLLTDEERLVLLGHQGAAAGDILAAERHCQLDRDCLHRAERELRGLALEVSEIAAIRQCAARMHDHDASAGPTSHWAELELRAPSDGVLVQAEAASGAAVRPGMLLFTISGR